MSTGNGNGEGHERGNGHPYRVLMEDEELAQQFEALVAAARARGLTEEEIGFGLFSATVESMLGNGEPECCVMQLLTDFLSSYFEYWHNRMADEEEWDEEEGES
ncbi:MAG: hypothetical protein AB1505_14510 [Candidatus Latescibacterota bacterium]